MNIQLKTQDAAALRPLTGKVSLVTGSTSGIGLGIARALARGRLGGGAERPWRRGRDRQDPGPDRRRFRRQGQLFRGRHDEPGGDRRDDRGDASPSHGRLDILVNNAGIQHVAPLEQFPVEKWDAILAINLSSAFHTTRLALPAMRQNKFGRIINIASAHGLVASPFKAAYVAAKHGIVGLTKVTALETAEDGITCNAICPGYVYTPLVEAQIDGQAKAHGISREQVIRDVLLAQQPNKRFATVEELGALTVFLASDAAASITGIALPVDGGWTAH